MISISIKSQFPISPLKVPPIGDQTWFNRLLEDLDHVQGQPFLSSCHTTLQGWREGFRPCHTSPREGEDNQFRFYQGPSPSLSPGFRFIPRGSKKRVSHAFPIRVATRVGDAGRADQSETVGSRYLSYLGCAC
jgi:hypothetical protein